MSAPLGNSSLAAVLYESGRLLSQGSLEGLEYQLAVFTANGTFTSPTPSVGYEIAYFIGTVYSGGDSGDKPETGGYKQSFGGRPGKRRSRRISVAEMGASQAITVGAGGASKTSAGAGNVGSPSSIGYLLSSSAGAAGIPTPYGDIASASSPGRGGDGGLLIVDDGGDSTTYYRQGGSRGEDTSGARGGNPGNVSGWFGSGSVSPEAGQDGGIDGDHSYGGGGGGGGGANSGLGAASQAGAAGGAPGGGGGASGGNSGGLGSGPVGNSGPGGRGQVDILTVFKRITA